MRKSRNEHRSDSPFYRAHQQRNLAPARNRNQLLSSVYNRFSEGFETADLKTARAPTLDFLLAAGHRSGLRFFAGLLDELRK
jgi:hypothetical protein